MRRRLHEGRPRQPAGGRAGCASPGFSGPVARAAPSKTAASAPGAGRPLAFQDRQSAVGPACDAAGAERAAVRGRACPGILLLLTVHLR